jgi:hypothetical protein
MRDHDRSSLIWVGCELEGSYKSQLYDGWSVSTLVWEEFTKSCLPWAV